MGLSHIWDTNIAVYYFQKQFPLAGEKFIDDLLTNQKPAIFIITEIELLCWKLPYESDILMLKEFISGSTVYELENSIKLKTMYIRKQAKLKLLMQ